MYKSKIALRPLEQMTNKVFKLRFIPSAKIAAILLLAVVLFSSCGGKDTIYVWNMKDIIGLWVFGILLVFLALVFVFAWISDKIDNRKRKSKKR